jgi:glutamate N-acetyltransferase/amino-acid N-acetyltransferase
MKKIKGGVCAARGFVAGALRAGIKRVASTKDDLAVVLSELPCTAAGVFTTNRVQAAPVLVSKKHLRGREHWGIVLNSGNANACTGDQGMADALATTEKAASIWGGTAARYLVCSTGRIGVPLPMPKLLAGLEQLPAKVSRQGSEAAAVAIMTSDSFPKEAAVSFSLHGKTVRLGGLAKGAGMINPNMATMLCVLTTDAALPPTLGRKLLQQAVDASFNRITVDGDMSTNDTVLLLANGASDVTVAPDDKEACAALAGALQTVCTELARMIVRDGEGTTKVVEVVVRGARNPAQARRAAEAVGNSILLKCAWAGGDPNWGRIMDALGYSGAVFSPTAVDIFYNREHLVKDGAPGPAKPEKVAAVAALDEFTITIDLHAGSAAYALLSADLTEEYVRLNLSE